MVASKEVIRVASEFETRASASGTRLTGFIPYDAAADMGRFQEVVRRGAFDGAFLPGADVVALHEHKPELLLARKSAGTLQLHDDRDGLRYTINLPDTRAGKDVETLAKRGDLKSSSFGFRVADPLGDSWERTARGTIRELRNVVLNDVSPVCYPAYKGATVSLRSLPAPIADTLIHQVGGYDGLSLDAEELSRYSHLLDFANQTRAKLGGRFNRALLDDQDRGRRLRFLELSGDPSYRLQLGHAEFRDWATWDAQHPERDHGNKISTAGVKNADTASRRAARLSSKAQKSGGVHDHALAAEAHLVAAKLHEAAGDHGTARGHSFLAYVHSTTAKVAQKTGKKSKAQLVSQRSAELTDEAADNDFSADEHAMLLHALTHLGHHFDPIEPGDESDDSDDCDRSARLAYLESRA